LDSPNEVPEGLGQLVYKMDTQRGRIVLCVRTTVDKYLFLEILMDKIDAFGLGTFYVNMNPIILCVEGNIGSGKSTFMQKLKARFGQHKHVCFLDEPVDTWSHFKDGEGTILEHYYKDQQTWGFTFQMLAYISRLTLLRRALENPDYKYIVTERSLFTDKNIFCKMLYENGVIHPIQYQIYQAWFDEFMTTHEYKFIYLRTTPEVAFTRVNKRGRKGETIPLSYLEDCHRYHEAWLQKEWVFDADVEEADTERWVTQIQEAFHLQDVFHP